MPTVTETDVGTISKVQAECATESVKAAAISAANHLLLDLAKSLDAGTPLTVEEVVARIQTIPPDPANYRRAEPGLDEVLRRQGDSDEPFDEVAWSREWQVIEAELKRLSG